MKKASQVSKLDEQALVTLLESDPVLRKRARELFENSSDEQAREDGGRFIDFKELTQLPDAALGDSSNAVAKTIQVCKKLKVPISEQTRRSQFEHGYVDQYSRHNSYTEDGKVRKPPYYKSTDEDGLKWYAYRGEKSNVEKCKKEAIKMGVNEDRISVSGKGSSNLEICFLDTYFDTSPAPLEDVDDDSD